MCRWCVFALWFLGGSSVAAAPPEGQVDIELTQADLSMAMKSLRDQGVAVEWCGQAMPERKIILSTWRLRCSDALDALSSPYGVRWEAVDGTVLFLSRPEETVDAGRFVRMWNGLLEEAWGEDDAVVGGLIGRLMDSLVATTARVLKPGERLQFGAFSREQQALALAVAQRYVVGAMVDAFGKRQVRPDPKSAETGAGILLMKDAQGRELDFCMRGTGVRILCWRSAISPRPPDPSGRLRGRDGIPSRFPPPP